MIFEILDRLSGRKARRETMILQASMAFDPERWETSQRHKRRQTELIFNTVMASVEAEAACIKKEARQ